jgi:hypothetical protein
MNDAIRLQIDQLVRYFGVSMKFKAGKMRGFFSGPGSAVFLLLLYFAGNVQFETFHDVFHSVEQSLHTPEQEEDPCHRAIYHEVESEGCDHETHLTAVEQCPLCHVVPTNTQNIEASHAFESRELSNEFGVYAPISLHAWRLIDLPARAPPVG